MKIIGRFNDESKSTVSQSKYVETTPGDLAIWTFIQSATITYSVSPNSFSH